MSDTTEIASLPSTGDYSKWTDQEKALVEAAGLVYSERKGAPKQLAERPVVEAFLAHCRRTGLDPIARQIYCIRRAGKWQTQISIDGARLVAERSRQYEGQTAAEWSDDGRTWFDAWVQKDSESFPKFARVGVYRAGFREALKVVARWDSYAVMDDVWSNGSKTGEKKVSSMWAKMPDLMLAKVAEMLALRKAFPQDLSGLYSSEEMAQAGPVQVVQESPARELVEAKPEPIVVKGELSRDWVTLAEECTDLESLRVLHGEAQQAGELGLVVADGRKVGGVLWDRRAVFTPMVDAPEPESKPVTLDVEPAPVPTPLAAVPFEDDPSQPTADELADWAAQGGGA
ncbi:phage recombination protein Bet [Glaciibacter superstes]|uniref:phage recombination protein Bet n=1 Tax=Glaciibacter superstes TaxID=501023 RepID=UPI0003B2F055|nr:phage recombination protein Bet [Glaciibacter superstes]